ncbi:MAG: serine hydrolase domain-containing protein [Chloroflexota bacterium]
MLKSSLSKSTLSASQIEIINEQLQQIMSHPARPLASLAAVAFVDGEICYEGYFGHRQIDPTDDTRSLPVNQNTKYRVASISKLVTSLGIMQLAEQDKLSLDADVSDYLGFKLRNPHHPDTAITLRMLLSHTSSIRDGDESYSLPLPHTMSDFFDPASPHYHDGCHWAEPDQKPGIFFTYSNLNYGLVGTLIEVASGQRFDRYIHEHLLSPLGIDASYNISGFSETSLQNLATLYRKQSAGGTWHPHGPWVPQVDDYRSTAPINSVPDAYTIGTNGTLFSPQGGLRISTRDLVKIALLISGNGAYQGIKLLESDTIHTMLTSVWTYQESAGNGDPYGGLMRQWGLGIHLTTDTIQGDRLVEGVSLSYVGHSGDAYGLHSGLWFDPKSASGFAFCIGGVSDNPVNHCGQYSAFYRWEEEIMTVLHQAQYNKVR